MRRACRVSVSMQSPVDHSGEKGCWVNSECVCIQTFSHAGCGRGAMRSFFLRLLWIQREFVLTAKERGKKVYWNSTELEGLRGRVEREKREIEGGRLAIVRFCPGYPVFRKLLGGRAIETSPWIVCNKSPAISKLRLTKRRAAFARITNPFDPPRAKKAET